MKELLDVLGIDSASAVAGFCGGLLNIFFYKSEHIYDMMGSLIVGCVMGAYFGPTIADLIHLPHIFTACAIGGAGTPFFGLIISMVRTRLIGNVPAEGKRNGQSS